MEFGFMICMIALVLGISWLSKLCLMLFLIGRVIHCIAKSKIWFSKSSAGHFGAFFKILFFRTFVWHTWYISGYTLQRKIGALRVTVKMKRLD